MAKEKKKQGALELVVLRNAFYRDSYRRAALGLLFLFGVNCLLAGTIIYKIMSPPKPQYFATTADGRMINWHPLTDPAVPNSFVLQWTANAVRQSFSLDYLHWRNQLQEASNNFTNYGWKTFNKRATVFKTGDGSSLKFAELGLNKSSLGITKR